MRLRLDLEEDQMERSYDSLRRCHAPLGQSFSHVAHKHTMKVVLKMRILEPRNDGKRVTDPALRDDFQ